VGENFDVYRKVGHRLVQGWMLTEVLTMLAAVDAVQRAQNVGGAVAEIGVHRGKLFIGLKLLQHGDETAVAIDVFGDQDLNVDHSGNGDYQRFLKNVERWSSIDGLVVHQGDSTQLQPQRLVELAGSGVRIFSVDGGHTEQIVTSDMRLAEETLAEGGVVVADDVFNAAWPGVAVGTLRYLDEGGALAPFVIGFNKVLFSRPEFCHRYRDAVIAPFGNRARIEVKDSVFAGHPVTVLDQVSATPRRILRRNAVAKSVSRIVHSS
jgi:hypothetical protein